MARTFGWTWPAAPGLRTGALRGQHGGADARTRPTTASCRVPPAVSRSAGWWWRTSTPSSYWCFCPRFSPEKARLRAHPSRGACHRRPETRRLHRLHAVRRRPPHPQAAQRRRPNSLARVVHPLRTRRRPGNRRGLRAPLRCFCCAGRLHGRHGRGTLRLQRARRRRCAAHARRLRRHVLPLHRHALRPAPGAGFALTDRGRAGRRRWSASRWLPSSS